MLGWLTGRTRHRRTGQQLYERIVAQARDPSLYQSCGVPDTMDGRLEMVLLHTVLLLERLQTEGNHGQRVGQQLMEILVADLDDALRRIGLGDDSVSARIKRLAGALRERAYDYRAAFEVPAGPSGADVLVTALLEHVYRTDCTSPGPDTMTGARRLAGYVRHARPSLAASSSHDVLTGDIAFPPVIDPSGRSLETRL
jgi:cytochrome b pre-mRNA-processing protein 3